MLGKKFDENLNLEQALRGELVYELYHRQVTGERLHFQVPLDKRSILEYYIPIWNSAQTEVLFVAEVYKRPVELLSSMKSGLWFLWIGAITGGVLLYVLLLWIVHRANIALQEQQRSLVESETMAVVGEMASAVAHGIRNPLASIRSSAELALEEQPPGARREATQDIVAEADRMDLMIRELIQIARQDVCESRPICIAETIRECIDEFVPAMRKQSVKLQLDIAEPLAVIRGDPSVLRQALRNVIANALEAMPQGGSLDIAARLADHGKRVDLSVADNGHGISQDRMAQIFRPFVSSKRGGLGIGLALVKRIVERHGGSVALASKEGRGTTVTIRLPAEVG